MNLRHVGLVCGSEENADRFFGGVLRLTKAEPKTLPRGLSKALFDIDRELTIINYTGEGVHFEVFIDPFDGPDESGPLRVNPDRAPALGPGCRRVDARGPRRAGRIEHVCLDVRDLSAFLARCRDAGATVIQVPKGDSLLTFIRDADDNLFEIKEQVTA